MFLKILVVLRGRVGCNGCGCREVWVIGVRFPSDGRFCAGGEAVGVDWVVGWRERGGGRVVGVGAEQKAECSDDNAKTVEHIAFLLFLCYTVNCEGGANYVIEGY